MPERDSGDTLGLRGRLLADLSRSTVQLCRIGPQPSDFQRLPLRDTSATSSRVPQASNLQPADLESAALPIAPETQGPALGQALGLVDCRPGSARSRRG